MALADTEIVLRLGESAGAEFHSYWEREIVGAKKAIPGARFRHEQKPTGGAAMALPAEVTIVAGQIMELLQSDIAKEALKTAGTAAGTAIAKFLWEKLIDFFKKPHRAPVPEKVVIIVNRREIIVSPRAMDTNPPKHFEDALH